MNGWTIAKYLMVLAGLGLVLGADRVGAHWISYPGLGLILLAFLLRFLERRMTEKSRGSLDGTPG